MKYIQLKLLCLLLLSASNLKALDSTVFNGKKYFVYPHEIIEDDGERKTLDIDLFTLQLVNNEIPPIIGNYIDGEYLMKKKKLFSYYLYVDTIEYVYATFTIKNNQKNGNAFIYNFTQKVMPIISFNYKDDVLDGEVNGTFSFGYRNYFYYNNSNIFNYLELSEQISNMPMTFPDKFKKVECHLNFRNGFLDGNQSAVLLTKNNKQHPLLNFQYKNGQRNGKFSYYNYTKPYHQRIKIKKCEGYLETGKKTGIWEMYVDDVLFKKIEFKNNKLKSEYTYEKNTLINAVYFSGDSLKKYIPGYRKDIKLPLSRYGDFMRVSASEGFSNMDLFVTPIDTCLLIDFRGNQPICSFVIGDSVNRNFYLNILKVRDTLINGYKLFYWSNVFNEKIKKGTTIYKSYFIMDTVNSNLNYFYACKRELVILFTLSVLDKDTSIRINNQTDRFDGVLSQIFNSTVLNRKYADKNCIIESFTDLRLKFDYVNFNFTKGKMKGFTVTHELIGENKNTIVRKMILPSKYGTLLLADTLFKDGKTLYKTCQLFYDNYTRNSLHDFNNRRWVDDFKVLNNYFYLMFDVKPILHRSINFNGKPFTGEFDLNYKYVDNPGNYKLVYIEADQFFYTKDKIRLSLEIDSKVTFIGNSHFVFPYSQLHFSCMQGQYNFNMWAKDFYGNDAILCSYSNNYMDGSFNYHLYSKHVIDLNYQDYYWIFDVRKLDDNNFNYLDEKSMYFFNGQPSGQNANYQNNNIIDLYTYNDGLLNGTQYHFYPSTTAIQNIYNVNNDTINGPFYKLNPNGNIVAKGYIHNGMSNGNFREYHNTKNSGVDTTKLSRNYFLKNDVLVGYYSEFSKEGIVKLKIKFDEKDSNRMYNDYVTYAFKTINFNYLYRNNDTFDNALLKFNLITNNEITNNLTAYFWYHYDDGNLFCHGNRVNSKRDRIMAILQGRWQNSF